jgi:signal transduction histidine kinase
MGDIFECTARHEAVEALGRATRSAEAATRAKTEFFDNVSHEFRTPLTLMLGPLEDLRGGVRGEDGTRAEHLPRHRPGPPRPHRGRAPGRRRGGVPLRAAEAPRGDAMSEVSPRKHCLLVVDHEPDICDSVYDLLRLRHDVARANSAGVASAGAGEGHRGGRHEALAHGPAGHLVAAERAALDPAAAQAKGVSPLRGAQREAQRAAGARRLDVRRVGGRGRRRAAERRPRGEAPSRRARSQRSAAHGAV